MNRAGWCNVMLAGLVMCCGVSTVAQCPNRAGDDSPAAAGEEAKRGEGLVRVAGKSLERDGRPWTPHGVNLIAFVTAPRAQAVESVVFRTAYECFRPEEFAAMRQWGADTVRMQVSQPGVDPANQLHSDEFVQQVEAAVRAARAAGLNVIVSVQDETQSGQDPENVPGEAPEAKMPDGATERVWGVLARAFNADRGVMYEMFNEPEGPAALYPEWGKRMDAVLAAIRATGSKNVLVADGLQYATNLEGVPELKDPEHAVAYGLHPYFHKMEPEDEASWDRKFGDLAKKHPVVATEWTTVYKPQPDKPHGYLCDARTPEMAVRLLAYLEEHRIGMTAYTWDFAGDKFGSVRYGFPEAKNSTFAGKQCGDAGFGPGEVLQEWFRTGVVPRS